MTATPESASPATSASASAAAHPAATRAAVLVFADTSVSDAIVPTSASHVCPRYVTDGDAGWVPAADVSRASDSVTAL
jgi:hypothetical protein